VYLVTSVSSLINKTRHTLTRIFGQIYSVEVGQHGSASVVMLWYNQYYTSRNNYCKIN